MKRILYFFMLAVPQTIQARQLDVPFQITEDDQAAECLGAQVESLDPNGDGLLSMRTGPGSSYTKIDIFRNGDTVRPCVKQGDWCGVYYGNPRHVGWVYSNWIGGFAG